VGCTFPEILCGGTHHKHKKKERLYTVHEYILCSHVLMYTFGVFHFALHGSIHGTCSECNIILRKDCTPFLGCYRIYRDVYQAINDSIIIRSSLIHHV
jgi:hypothetical protein